MAGKDNFNNLVKKYENLNIQYIDNAMYYCYFNMKEDRSKDRTTPTDGSDFGKYYVYQLSYDKYPENTYGGAKKIKVDKPKIPNITKSYQRILELSSKIKINNNSFNKAVAKKLGPSLGFNFDDVLPANNTQSFVTSVDKVTAKQVIGELNSFYNEINSIDFSKIKRDLYNQIKPAKITVNTDLDWKIDTSYGYVLSTSQRHEIAKDALDSATVEFIIPGLSDFITNYINKNSVELGYTMLEKDKVVSLEYEQAMDIIKELDSIKKELLSNITILKKKAKKVKDKYAALEKTIEKEFKGKDGKKYNKNKIADTYHSLVLKYGKEKADKLMKKYLKKTGSKITLSKVHSLYKKKYIEGKLLKGNVKFDGKNKKPEINSGSGGSDTSASTGSTVVTATSIAATGKPLVVNASIKKELKQIKKGLQEAKKVEIENINKMGQNEIDQINEKAAVDKANLEIEKNRLKADINEEAIKEINAISETDADASNKINEIVDKRDKALALVDQNYETEVNRIDVQKEEQIKAVNDSVNAKVNEINEFYDKKINTVNEAMKSDKIGKGAMKKLSEPIVVASKVEDSKPNTTSQDRMKVLAEDITKSQETYTASNNDFKNAVEAKQNAIDNAAVGTPVDEQPVQEPTPQPEPQPQPVQEPEPSTPTASSSSNYSSDNNSGYSEPTTSTETSKSTSDVTNAHPSVPKSVGSDTIKKDTINTKIIDDNTNKVITPTPKSTEKSSGGSGVIPAVLGVGAAGAAAVAGVRYVKNKRDNSYEDEEYDDENNASVYGETSDDYNDGNDYLGPAGSEYTDTSSYEAEPSENIVPDENSYVDPSALSDEEEIENFEDDEVMKGLK